jgi:hypothetical protein
LLAYCFAALAERIYTIIALGSFLEIRVPVTAKLSRKFYERLGDDIATELVDWFNAVDETYRNQLKEINEHNWERFKDHLDARLGDVRAELIKWMFVFWVGNVATLGGLIVGMNFFHR